MAKQEITGKAFEYACLSALFEKLNARTEVSVLDDVNVRNTKSAFEELSDNDKDDYLSAARRGVAIIEPLEPNLAFPDTAEPLVLSIQPDSKGKKGDVRDVLCIRSKKGWNIGLSCKHDHEAVKHSRLSRTIDFGKEWLGFPVSRTYNDAIAPIFDELDELKKKHARWAGIDRKDERFYKTLLDAFLAEMNALYAEHSAEVPENLLRYLLGRNDFYKVIAHTKDRTTEVKPFNMYGMLGLSTRAQKSQYKIAALKMPSQILSMAFKNGSLNTILIHCDNGWSLSLRIHNASEWVEPSLKFDIQLIGVPVNMGTRIESW
ncbi:MAG: HaeIII family restriction endonuclease [Treponema sp.]|nr:HaeIII family restriction endonuclease [Treponema sp.]